MTRGRDKFAKFKPLINVLIKFFNLFPKSFLRKVFLLFRGTKGIKGITIRYILLKCLAKSCGDNVSIHPNVYLFSIDKLSIGNNVSIHPMCYIDASGEIEIGDDVSIAHLSTIMSTNHNYKDLSIPIKDQGVTAKKVTIGSNIWIAAKATILSGVTIESGSVVAAGAVVCKNIDKNSVVGGIPAKLIKIREMSDKPC